MSRSTNTSRPIATTPSFLARLHHDESGPNTVEWALLSIVAFVALLAILVFVGTVQARDSDASARVEESAFLTGEDEAAAIPEAGEEEVELPATEGTPSAPPPVSGTWNPMVTGLGFDAAFCPETAPENCWSSASSSFFGPAFWFGSDGHVYMYDASGWTDVGEW